MANKNDNRPDAATVMKSKSFSSSNMNKHMKIVVIGGSGLIGTKLVNNLRQHGHEVVAASPSSGVNTITGEGLAKALAGAQVVVDVATRLRGRTRQYWTSSRHQAEPFLLRKVPLAWGTMLPCQSSALSACWRVVISEQKWPRKA